MRTMPRGPGADRSGWLLPIALFALLLPTVLGIVVDDGGIWVYDPFDDDDDRLRVAASARSGPAWTVPAPVAVRRADRSNARDPVVASWTSRTPTDRAPPRV
jgi:hypothetical protein